MPRYNNTYELLFPGDSAYTDITSIVDSRQTSMTITLTTEDLKSAIDSLSFTLGMKSAQQTVVEKLLDAQQNHERVFVRYSADSVKFTGYIRPTIKQSFSRGIPMNVSLEAEDMSYLLDAPMTDAFEYPSHIDNAPFYIFNPSDKENSIVHQRLYAAGYNDSQINNWMDPILDTIEYTSCDADSERTFRDYLDTLLYEYGYVQFFDNLGAWSYFKLSIDVITAHYSRTNQWLSRNGLQLSGTDNEYDGFKLTWSKLAVLRNVKLYSENLPIDDAKFTGKAIEANAYFPEDSDIQDVWQEYKSDWCDIPYMTEQSRVKNDDISMLTAKNIELQVYKDEGITLDGTPVFEPRRAKYRFVNGSQVQKLYMFDLWGDALIRNEVIEYTSSGSTNPKEYTSEFIFDEDTARLMVARMASWYQNTDMVYTWDDLQTLECGNIIQLSPENSVVSTQALIVGYTETNTGVVIRNISALGISEYQSQPVTITRRVLPISSNNVADASNSRAFLPFDPISLDKVVIS